VPAAAVIPAPIAYTNFVAVKKLVVGSGARDCRFGRALMRASALLCEQPLHSILALHTRDRYLRQVAPSLVQFDTSEAPVVVTVNKTACPKQARHCHKPE